MAFNTTNAYRKGKNGRMAVPQFGGWDEKAGGGTPDYSMVFTRARANKKQHKVDVISASLGHENEFLNFPHPRAEHHSAMKDEWMAVPQFGGWDQKAGRGTPDYSMVFNRARANRKQQKIDVNSSSLGHETEFLNFPHPRADQNPAMKKRSIFSCLICGRN